MKQVVIIHGGTTFSSYKDYLQYLRTPQTSVDRMIPMRKWKEGMQERLGSDYQVLLPSMPNSTNAVYEEWKLWFDGTARLLDDDCILIGHSLGGIFLAKYLSENKFVHRIKATILIATPFDDESGGDLTDFKLTGITDLFKSQAGNVTLYFGGDDPVIPASEVQKYKEQLPDAEFYELSAPDHFVRTDFPELVTQLQKL